MKNIFKKSLFLLAVSLVTSAAYGVSIYKTDLVANPTGATTQGDKGEFISAPSWASGYTSCYHTTGSAGAVTITFTNPIDLSGYQNCQFVLAWGAESNRPVNLSINGGTAEEIDKVASSSDRSNVRIATKAISVTSISSIKISGSGGGNSYYMQMEITGEQSGPVVSSDATLSSLVYGSDQTPVPNFSPNVLDYEVELSATYVGSAPSIQGTTNDAKANITDVSQATSIPGTASITVTAEDGTTTKTYTVTFTRASANPKVLTATWDNIEGTATIDQVNKSITGQVKNGSSLTLTPTFTGNNIQSWTPEEATDFSNGPVFYTFKSATEETTVYVVMITEAPAAPAEDYCTELYPAATGDTPAKGAEVALKTESYGGKIIFESAKDDNFEASFTYTEYGLQMNKGGKDIVCVELNNTLQAGSIIKLDIYQTTTSGDKNRGFNLQNTASKTVLEAVWTPTEEDKERTIDYTVVAGDGIEGTSSFLIQRSNSAVLKGVLVSQCGGTPTPPTPVAVESVELNKTTLTLEMGQTETLTATVKPDNAANQNVSWSSDNTAVATVDENGKISALTAGTANITVTTEDQGKTATCAVTVTAPAEPIEVESISIKSATTIKVGSSETLSVTYTPSNANTGKAITWTSDKPSIAKVDANGKVTGVAAGTAVITATTENDKTATCTVTVEKKSQIDTDLDLHEPEVYEAKEIAGGYNTPLTVLSGREYEVYYTERTAADGYPTFSTTPVTEAKTDGISNSTSETKNEGREGDRWFKGTIYGHSECKKASSEDEFVFEAKTIREHRLGGTDTYQFHVTGFDQFSLWGMDKKLDPKNGDQVWVVKVDGQEQETDASLYNKDEYTIRRYDLTSGEHLIEISTTCSGSNVCAMGGFSLRVSQEPRTKRLKGNDSTQVVYAHGAIKPVTYVTKYNNIPGAETKLEWLGTEVEGIALEKIDGELTDTLVLSGKADAPAGEYPYAVVAYYNDVETSRSEGKFYVKYKIEADTETDVDADQGEEMDEIKFKYFVYDEETDIIFQWRNDNEAPGITTSAKNGTFLISGVPTQEGTFYYLITVEGGDTIQGKIRVQSADLGVDPVLYLYKKNYENDYVYQYLKEIGYNIREKKTKDDLRKADQYAKYKWILISEDVDANNPEVFKILRGGVNLPILNMKAFTYSHTIDSLTADTLEYPYDKEIWGEANNGSLTENGKSITVLRDDHPIFKALHKKQGDKIQVLDSIERRGLMPIKVTKQSSLCLATAWTRNLEVYEADGKEETFLHEIPAGRSGENGKYLCFPIAISSSKYLTQDGKDLIKEVVKYLLNDESSVQAVIPEITSFAIDGVEGVITPGSPNTILVEIDSVNHPTVDLKAVAPQISMTSPYTHTVPASGDTVDLSYARYLPLEYVATDYIKRVVYELTIVWRTPQGIEEVYSVGNWVNVYDIYGRKVTTTNENIYTMDLPRGIYIVVTENGQTLKISR